ncbi:hypothetical protein E4U32_003764 [Claviceps aff. humidiphila group G2b]|uniref:Uncharacterized protein n=1 Tax=Claviceps arundinis TaxID=1623583 RepID=A0A9P7SL59_9HYPO|nr:hypothetical protein E4U57_006115 [Claviceps arundinis]KAG5960497.1 hypothetical protein E4U56_004336 [Claviceps arundinis]KAG6059903.1 hypothetical protein E4U32_003764 [Claviceps aff. humidiphila group G2b]
MLTTRASKGGRNKEDASSSTAMDHARLLALVWYFVYVTRYEAKARVQRVKAALDPRPDIDNENLRASLMSATIDRLGSPLRRRLMAQHTP